MDGKEILFRARQLLNEDSGSSFLDDRTTYQYVYEAAIELVARTQCLKATQSITTVADQVAYVLNADFLRLYLKNSRGNLFVKYNDGSSDTFITWDSYDNIIHGNQTTSVAVPVRFTILDKPALYALITGTATSTAAISNGVATLTDTAADFSNVSAGDIIHNTTDASDGVVLSKTSSTVLVTALFGGTNNSWTSTNAYIIQPQGRLQMVLDPPPTTAAQTVTVEYVQRPAPVFSLYGVYRFSPQYMNALIKYSAFLYKYRDKQADFGNALYQFFDRETRANKYAIDQSLNRTTLAVNLRKRRVDGR